MMRGKASDDKRREKVDNRRESDGRHEKSENDRRENNSPVHDAHRKETKRCKYCGGKHRFGQRKCSAFGKRCSACGIMNHFASQCMANANVNMVETESVSDDEYCLTLESLDESEILRVHSASDLNMRESCLLQVALEIRWIVEQPVTCYPQSTLRIGTN